MYNIQVHTAREREREKTSNQYERSLIFFSC